MSESTERLAAAREAYEAYLTRDITNVSDSVKGRLYGELLSAHREVLCEGVEGLDFEAAARESQADSGNVGAYLIALNAQHRAICGALRELNLTLLREAQALRERVRILEANTSKSVLKRLDAMESGSVEREAQKAAQAYRSPEDTKEAP
jgi:hypothetical protein